MLDVLDGAALRAWCTLGLAALTDARDEIDRLNVYPVPDGDTGINLQLTMSSVVEALGAAPHDHASTLRAIVTGSLMGARGNSGVIVSQLLRGLCDVLGTSEAPGPQDLIHALAASANSAYGAVGSPVEGTVLTVAREAAEGAVGDSLAEVVRSARVAAAASLARTPDLLPVLRSAGVVDAGGRGWCVLLEALEQVVTGQAPVAAPTLLVARDGTGVAASREAGSDEFGYEVQFLLRDATDAAVGELKDRLSALGDSLVVVGGDGLFNVHVHVNDVGAAVEAGVDAGRPFRITVTRFEDQVAAVRGGRAVVAVASGAGLVDVFERAGATVVDGGPSANPSTRDLLDALRATGATEVVLLPNDKNVHAAAIVAAQQAGLEGVSVQVVASRSVVQGLAALAVSQPDRAFGDDVAAMTEAAGAMGYAEVTTAVRASQTEAGPCAVGDVLGLVSGQVAVVGDDLGQVLQDVTGVLLAGGGELLTLVLGAQAPLGSGHSFTAYVAGVHPGVEVHVIDGGQPHYPFLLGVE